MDEVWINNETYPSDQEHNLIYTKVTNDDLCHNVKVQIKKKWETFSNIFEIFHLKEWNIKEVASLL